MTNFGKRHGSNPKRRATAKRRAGATSAALIALALLTLGAIMCCAAYVDHERGISVDQSLAAQGL